MASSGLQSFLQNMSENPDLVDEQDDPESRTAESYRRISESLESKEDKHLLEWVERYRVNSKLGSGPTFEEVKQLLFAEGHRTMLASATRYITWAAEHVKPVHNKDDKVRIKTLEDRRSSIFKWIQRETDFTLSEKERDTMTKAIIVGGKTYGINTAPRDDKQYLGRPEIVQMLEEDSLRSDRFDVSESHYLAWSLDVVCGVRPRSTGTAKGKEGKKFPRWSDVTITRDSRP
jgi:hypothetical protein